MDGIVDILNGIYDGSERVKWVDVNVWGWESGGMDWIYRLRWDSRECDGFIMKWVCMSGDWLM